MGLKFVEPVYPDSPPAEPVLIEDIAAKRLSKQQRRIVREFLCRGFVSHEQLHEAIWGWGEDGGPLDMRAVVKVQISRIRNSLRPGWTIRKRHGFGYVLDKE